MSASPEDGFPAWPAEVLAELSPESCVAFDAAATSLKRAVDTGDPALYRIAVLRIAAAADLNLADHTRKLTFVDEPPKRKRWWAS